MNSVILLNIEIEDNCIIAADSVVKVNYENNSVIVGVTALRIVGIKILKVSIIKKLDHKCQILY